MTAAAIRARLQYGVDKGDERFKLGIEIFTTLLPKWQLSLQRKTVPVPDRKKFKKNAKNTSRINTGISKKSNLMGR